jgi:vitamin B12 transporter
MVGTAFREPTFGENFGEVAYDVGNPDLLPERTRSWELGVERHFGPLLLTATWFDQRFEDMILYTSATSQPTDPNYVNVGGAAAVGLELTAGAVFGPIAMEGSFTRLNTDILDPGTDGAPTLVEGEPLLRRPSNSGSMTARWALPEGSFAGTLHFVGERADADFSTFQRVTLDGYTTFDLSGEHAIPLSSPVGARAFFRIENLLGSEYNGVFGFRAPGRVIRIGARFGVGW